MLRSPCLGPHRLLFAGLFVTAACESSADTELPGGVPFLEEDSAGVRVATTLGTRARSPIGWVVDTVPEYQLGELDGEEPYLFTSVGGARQLSDGRVVVLNRSGCDLRFFGTDGVFLKRAGGRGEGPGEFPGHCLLVPSADVDSLFAYGSGRLRGTSNNCRFAGTEACVTPRGLAGQRRGTDRFEYRPRTLCRKTCNGRLRRLRCLLSGTGLGAGAQRGGPIRQRVSTR